VKQSLFAITTRHSNEQSRQ